MMFPTSDSLLQRPPKAGADSMGSDRSIELATYTSAARWMTLLSKTGVTVETVKQGKSLHLY